MVPCGISLMAKAPIPPFGDGRASKYSVVKRAVGWDGEGEGGGESNVDLAGKVVEWKGAKVGKEAENDVSGEVSGVIGTETDWRNTCFGEIEIGSWGDWLALLVTFLSGYGRLAYSKILSKHKALTFTTPFQLMYQAVKSSAKGWTSCLSSRSAIMNCVNMLSKCCSRLGVVL